MVSITLLMFNWAEKAHAKKDYSAGRSVGFRGFI
jgi:hypothetical protein